MTVKMMTYGKNRLLALAMMATLFALALILTLPVSAQSDFDCSAVTEIPTLECEALVLLYDNGSSWNIGYWFENNAPCSWEGVRCEEGSIIHLDPPHNEYSGVLFIPAEIVNLTNLRDFDLTDITVELPHTMNQMSALRQLWLGGTGLDSLPEEIGELSDLRVIDVSRNNLATFPTVLTTLPALEEVYVSYNDLTEIPAEISNLTALRIFRANDNQLTTIPETIANLINLGILNLESNELTELPDSVIEFAINSNVTVYSDYNPWEFSCELAPIVDGSSISVTECEALVTLYNNLDGENWTGTSYWNDDPTNWLQTFNICWWDGVYCNYERSHITQLYLPNEAVGDVPAEIGNLTELSTLVMSESGITSLPAEIGNLTNLERLGLEHNQLTTLPAEIGNLTQLVSLYVSHNQLTELPAELGNLSALKQLSADDNQLTAIPAELENITTLYDLFLNDNQLTTVAADFSNMSDLRNLHLQNNQLTAVPAGLDALPDSTWINLSNNQLTTDFDCATAIQILLVECEALVAIFNSADGYGWDSDDPSNYYYGNPYGENGDLWFTTTTPCSWSGVTCTLARITALNLSDYGLSGALPPEISNLTELTDLIARNNALTEVPAEIGSMTKLEQLDLFENQIASLPVEIGNLTNLAGLTLGGNGLTVLPDEIGNLTNLVGLWLANNDIATLPTTIDNLTNLHYLHLTNNQLTTLPDAIGNFTQLKELTLSYNPLTSWSTTLTNLPILDRLDLNGLCSPDDPVVSAWINQYRNLVSCSDLSVAGLLWIERDGIDGFGITDQPIVSATVQMQRGVGQLITVTTDATGQYNFTTLPFGTYTLTVDTTTFTTTATSLTDPDDVLDNAIEIYLSSRNTTAVNQNFSYFSCTAVTEIPVSECEALLAIYNENGGQNWTPEAQEGWLNNSTPCSWANVICEDGHVKELRFFSAGLVGDMSPAVGAFSELTHLGLWDNRLLSLPAELVDLTKLERLDIGRNPWATFPTHVTDVTSLLGLYVADANLTALPDDINNLTALEDLHLWENRLIELPEGIGDLVNMERLILRDNLLQNLPFEVTNLTNLARLDVKYNNLATLPAQLETIDSLNEIDIQGNDIPCSQIGDWTNVQGACMDDSDIPLAVDMGGMETGTDSPVPVLLFLPFVMAAVTKQTLSQ